MVQLFEMYKSEMTCQVVVTVFETKKSLSVVDEVYDPLVPLCVLPPDDVPPINPLDVVAQPKEPTVTENQGDGASASNVAASEGTAAKEAGALEPDREPDIFDNAEEYVGVDDEHMYIHVPPSQPAALPLVHCSLANAPSPVESHEYVDASAEGGVPPEVEIDDADPEDLNVVHDPENPRIEKGSLFPDIISFRKAIRHYAVTTGFEFKDMKTDKTRFIAKCAHTGCPWRIHASRLYDQKTIAV